jgi:RNA polymerase sigma factor (TIGR02999 family)
MQILELQVAEAPAPPPDSELFSAVYSELRHIAAFHMRSERFEQTIQATALVHETFLKLARSLGPLHVIDRSHVLRLASQAMRRILVDRARARIARKRDSSEARFWGLPSPEEFVELHEALERLGRFAPRPAKIVEMRFFGGMTEEEVALALGICSRTVKRDWKLAKAWLYGELVR